jgi:hypothetical protein
VTFQLGQVGFDPIEHRLRFGRAKRTPCVSGHLTGAILDVVRLPDPLQNLEDVAGRTVDGFEELGPRMHPTGDFADRIVRSQEDVVIAAVSVSVQIALEPL